MSVCTRAICAHGQGAFLWLGDGPEADGTYPWVHDSSTSPGHLEVCDLMPFATAEEAGEVCACGHPGSGHKASGPVPPGRSTRPRPCSCGCPDFRHRPEDLARWRAKPLEAVTAAAESPLESDVPSRPVLQLELFGVPAAPPGGEADADGWPPCEVCGASSGGPHYDGSPDLCYRHHKREHDALRLAAVRAVLGVCAGCGSTRPEPGAISRQCWNCGADADAGRPTETVRVMAGVL